MNYLPFVVFLLLSITVSAQNEQLIPFELEDQFKREYTHDDYNGKMVVLIASDGGGSKYNGDWGRAISQGIGNDKIRNDIAWIGLADLGSVPFFMKGIVRGYFPESEDEWVLMDWDGEFDESYSFKDGMSNILVFNAGGKLLYKTAGKEVDNNKLGKVIEIIRDNYHH